jgi:HK97 family phage prohead protease
MQRILKTLKLEDVSLKFDGETGFFSGYASVFGGVDSYGDTIIKGAFEATLRNGKPKMFFNHDWGSLPIGKYTKAKEDDKGLWLEGELTPGLSRAMDVRAAMKHGTLDGLSVGGWVKKGDYEEVEHGRIIRKWSNLVEVSPVVFPADTAARVDLTSVKSMGIDIEALLPECETERDLERLLRDAGLGKKESMALLSKAKAIFIERDAPKVVDVKTTADIVERLKRLAQ